MKSIIKNSSVICDDNANDNNSNINNDMKNNNCTDDANDGCLNKHYVSQYNRYSVNNLHNHALHYSNNKLRINTTNVNNNDDDDDDDDEDEDEDNNKNSGSARGVLID